MLNLLTLFSGPYALLARWVVLVALVAAIAGFGAYKMHQHDQKKYDALKREYDTFKGGVAALGAAAQQVKEQTDARLTKAKTDADKTLADAISSNASNLARLRKQRDDARSSSLPSAPANTSRPNLYCADRAILEQGMGDALRLVREGGRGLADKGTENTLRLSTAIDWARAIK